MEPFDGSLDARQSTFNTTHAPADADNLENHWNSETENRARFARWPRLRAAWDLGSTVRRPSRPTAPPISRRGPVPNQQPPYCDNPPLAFNAGSGLVRVGRTAVNVESGQTRD